MFKKSERDCGDIEVKWWGFIRIRISLVFDMGSVLNIDQLKKSSCLG